MCVSVCVSVCLCISRRTPSQLHVQPVFLRSRAVVRVVAVVQQRRTRNLCVFAKMSVCVCVYACVCVCVYLLCISVCACVLSYTCHLYAANSRISAHELFILYDLRG